MIKKKYIIFIILISSFCIIFGVRTYGEYYNPVKNAVMCTDRAYDYAEKTCQADSLEEAKYYAQKTMKAVECVKDAVYDVDALLLTYGK